MKAMAVFLAGGVTSALLLNLPSTWASDDEESERGLQSRQSEEQSRQPPKPVTPAAKNDWLAEDRSAQRGELQRHLRGLDVAMVEIGYRFNELYWAGRDRNWPYAKYQIEKVELAMKLALERRPKRAASSKPFLEETIPLVKKAIEQAAATGDRKVYDDAMGRLRTDCMKCHVEEDVPHFTVYFSKTRTSSIRPD